MAARVAVLLCAVAAACVASGCAQERVVNYRPALLGTLPHARTGTPVSLDAGRPRPGAEDARGEDGRFDPSLLRSTAPDGRVTLIARRPYHLMTHIYYTLIDGESELLAFQVLSETTRREFLDMGRDPREAYEMLVARQRDILRLFAAMPQGELTPGVRMQKVGERVYRLEATGADARRLPWRFMDITMEHGHWRLRWFGP